jgi:hypothetical protein
MEELQSAEKPQTEIKEERKEEVKAQQPAPAEARPDESGQAVARKEQEILALKTDMEGLVSRVKSLDGALAAAVGSYRASVVQANPDILPELISGTSVVEIDESIKRAREIVARVKKGVETESARGRFPVGAPERGGLDAGLSPREKIQQGISRI